MSRVSGEQPPSVVVTGADGFLGGFVCRQLAEAGVRVRGLVQPRPEAGDPASWHPGIEVRYGDVRSSSDLDHLLEGVAADAGLIHTAGIVTIESRVSPEVRAVNVGGTANVVKACRRHGIRRMVHTGSVHALADDRPGPIREASEFIPSDPSQLIGAYPQSKAEAAAAVLAANGPDLETVLVHPSGLIGPRDPGPGPMTALMRDLARGRLPAYVPGGYDFVDVRDVANVLINALDKGRPGEIYLATGRYLELSELVAVVEEVSGRRRPRLVIPNHLITAVAPALEWAYAKAGRQPLFSRYSMHVLTVPVRYDHSKSAEELGYDPRDPADSVRDTVRWLLPGS